VRCLGCGQSIPPDYTETHPGPHHDSCCPDCVDPLDRGAALDRSLRALGLNVADFGPTPDTRHPTINTEET